MASITPATYRRLWIALIVFGAMLFGAAQPAAPALASGYAYYWSLTFDFDTDITGVLHVVVGYNDNGAPADPPIYETNTKVECRRSGSDVSVVGGALKLNGGFLRCELNIEEALNQAFAACNSLVPGCRMGIEDEEHYANFRAEATVWSSSPGEAPVFYHPDASYTITPQSSMSQITATLAPHGVIASTPAISAPALNTWLDYSAFYGCDAGCDMRYDVGLAVESVPTAKATVPFDTQATAIYIGYNPVSGVTAPAGTLIDSLFVDPPNYGND
ncbi:MAG: hypothetical protein R2873_09920 [Caldilineaceae bacterium]